MRHVLIFTLLLCAGCSRPPTTTVSKATTTAPAADLGPAREALRKPFADAEQVRFGLDLLNSALARQSGVQTTNLSPDDVKLVASLGADPADVANMSKPEFGPLDTPLVAQALLFRDVARTLDVSTDPPLDRAKAAMEWVVRHVRLDERDGPPDPPAQVVLRGRGTVVERTYVLLALLHQLGLDAFAVGGADAAGDPRKIWAVGVADSGQVFLFSPAVGLPLPGATPGGIATLADAASHAKLPQAFGMSRESMAGAKLYFGMPWPALAPRMKAIEALFPSGEVRIGVDFARLRETAKSLPLGQWAAKTYGSAPRVLAEFATPDDGGTDAAPIGARRAELYAAGLIQWEDLPRELLELRGPAGNQLRLNYVSVAASDQRPGLAQAIRHRQNLADVVRTMKAQGNEMPDARLQDDIALGVMAAMRGGGDASGPTLRQLLLRGQFQEATEAMVALAGQLRSLRGRSDVAGAAEQVRPWVEKVQTAYAEFLRAQRGGELAALNDATAKLETLLKEGRPLEQYVQWLAAGQMLAKLDYLIALAKHDQAEARHRRDPADAVRAWQTVVAAWRSFLANHPNAPQANQVRRLLGRALAQSGQRDAAVQMYREAAAKSAGPDKAAAEWLAERAGDA